MHSSQSQDLILKVLFAMQINYIVSWTVEIGKDLLGARVQQFTK